MNGKPGVRICIRLAIYIVIKIEFQSSRLIVQAIFYELLNPME